jgi:hypothetical protein
VLNNPVIFVDPNGMDTYLIIYGQGWHRPGNNDYNVGEGFKRSAEAMKNIMEMYDNLKEGDAIVVVFAKTEKEFLDAVNKEYESGAIKELAIYTHGTANSINLGGTLEGGSAQDYRLVSVDDNEGAPGGENEIKRIDKNNFTSDAKCTIWGCNVGGQTQEQGNSYRSFAGHLSVHLGRGRKVYASVGGGGQEFKVDENGKPIYDGTMIRSADRKSQQVNLTLFTVEGYLRYRKNKK